MSALDHLNSSGEEAASDLDTMDVSLSSISCQDDLMTSDFFDSVMSLENDVDGLLTNFDEEINLSSSDVCSGSGSISGSGSVPSPRSLSSSDYLDGFDDYNDVQQLEGFSEVIHGQLDGFNDTNPDEFDTKHGRVKVERLDAPDEVITKRKQPTRILIQNPNNKKFITKPIVVDDRRQQPIIKILPLNLNNVKILRTNTPIVNRSTTKQPKYNQSVALTDEERRLLAKEGINLPVHRPLTKTDERELKRIRRKIRNKISAQESRKRKKEYVDDLEAKVRRGLDENKTLQQRCERLRKHNRLLAERVKRLQSFVCGGASKAAPSTCLMVVLLSALLVSLPNLRLFDKGTVQNDEGNNGERSVAVRRSLLSSQQTAEDGWSMEDLLVFKDEEDFESRQDELALDNSTDEEIAKILDELTSNYSKNKGKSSEGPIGGGFFLSPPGKNGDFGGGRVTEGGFIEPDIDEYTGDEPPTDEIMGMGVKRGGSDFGYLGDGMRRIVSTTVGLFNGVKTEEK
ncbi:unnamed protein product [Phyllotreta striolata]|uniref:BZIP domain-containing protein n=1 Tax=Phyllotreta striolata TaxID=444603 RepID=A0A9N9TGQ4_PHYSR|nr:unnamed protein product [Phyllotreta striolata]